jgi:probable rRNA maturation factor
MIVNRQRSIHLTRRPSESFLRKICRELKVATSEVTICFVSDLEIARMNRRFRRKTGPTDVLSFPAFAQGASKVVSDIARRRKRRPLHTAVTGSRESNYLGDIAISPQTAKRNAKKYGRTLADELKILILHGMLHLLGYDHETDRGEMDRLEGKLRQRFHLA